MAPTPLILAAFSGDADEVRALLATPEGLAMVEVGFGSVSAAPNSWFMRLRCSALSLFTYLSKIHSSIVNMEPPTVPVTHTWALVGTVGCMVAFGVECARARRHE